jgi:hypothetical protein
MAKNIYILLLSVYKTNVQDQFARPMFKISLQDKFAISVFRTSLQGKIQMQDYLFSKEPPVLPFQQ